MKIKMKTKKMINQVVYAGGIIIVFGSHTAMLIMGGLEPQYMTGHAVINLIAGGMLAYSYITKK